LDTNPPAGAHIENSIVRRHVTPNLCHYDKASLLTGPRILGHTSAICYLLQLPRWLCYVILQLNKSNKFITRLISVYFGGRSAEMALSLGTLM
jgi:hypothetical protein